MSEEHAMVTFCDLVLEGGGVKGIALVGAIAELEQSGYQFRRVGGTSAGAVVGALVAAGMPGPDLSRLMRTVDYRRFQDESWLDRLPMGKALSLLTEGGVYEGDYLHTWLTRQLQSCRVETFADLAYDDAALDLPDEQQFKLVVMASDISQGRLSRLPWDYPVRYGLDAGRQSVADAVRASMSIPFFFEPIRLATGRRQESVLVDGGVLSNFPIDVFDRTNGSPRWPTFGLRLSAKPGAQAARFDVHDSISMTRALIGTMVSAHDQMHINDPSVVERTVFIDTFGVSSTDFDLDDDTAERLYQSGRAATRKFLDTWDWRAYKGRYRSGQRTPATAGAHRR